MDKVVCRECGREFHKLTQHLTTKHRMTYEEYTAKYPGAPTVSES